MPGTFSTVYIVAFGIDDRDQAVQAFRPRLAASEDAALEEARRIASSHAGVLVWRRDGDPVVGEEGDPIIIFSAGRVGDFS